MSSGFKKGLRGLDTSKVPTDVVNRYDSFDTYTFLRDSFPTTPSPAEESVLERVEQKVTELEATFFSDGLYAIEEFYLTATDPMTGERDWSRITGQDCDTAFWAINRCLLEAIPKVSRLYTETQFAWQVYQDTFQEAYAKPLEGTQGDRTASATKKTRESKYYFTYLHMIYTRINDRLEYIKGIKREIERSIERRVYDRNGHYQEG